MKHIFECTGELQWRCVRCGLLKHSRPKPDSSRLCIMYSLDDGVSWSCAATKCTGKPACEGLVGLPQPLHPNRALDLCRKYLASASDDPRFDYLVRVCVDMANQLQKMEQYRAVANAAWKERNVYRLQKQNAADFLRKRGWKQERANWICPDSRIAYPFPKALKIERNKARRIVEKSLEAAGYSVPPLEGKTLDEQCVAELAKMGVTSETPPTALVGA